VMKMTSIDNNRLDCLAKHYINDLTCIGEGEKMDLFERAYNHSVFCDTWLELRNYIDGKKVEIILYGKMKPEPRAMDFGSWE